MRAIAALGVLVGHVWGFAHAYGPEATSSFVRRAILGGGAGVWVFFALSGYLLFWPFVRGQFGGGGRIDLRRYALNRFVRILPLYYVVLVVIMLLGEGGGSPSQWGRYALFLENYSDTTIGGGQDVVVGTMWSLVVELHFYLLLPLLAHGMFRLAGRSLGRLALLLAALALASFTLRLFTFTLADQPSAELRYSLPSTLHFFVAGMLVAVLRVAWQQHPPRALAGPLGSADGWLLASAPVWALVFWSYDLEAVIAAASFLMVAACVLPLRPGPLVRALDWKPLALVGVASYSLYLWHLPIVEAIVGASWAPDGFVPLLAICLPLCVAVALVSYRLVEAPFLALRRRWSPDAAPQAEASPRLQPAGS